MPAVVIVGRKNVGKSTIFNRLTGMRLSIVFKEPGVTRDRVYGEVTWRGRMFGVIDTGGFFPYERDDLTHKINVQIKYGIAEADLVYFVVDGRIGLQPDDENIATTLRKSQKPVFLLVNKIDNRREESKALEFTRLGLEHMFCVSAECGTGFGDVLDQTLDMLPTVPVKKKQQVLRVAILGRPNAGKSTLLNAITKEERAIVDERPGTTRDLVHARLSFNGIDMEIIDTCGLKKKSRVKSSIEFYSIIRTAKVLDYIDIAVLIFDTSEGVVEQDRHIASLVMSKAKGLIIVPNKIDQINEKYRIRIVPSTRHSFPSYGFVPIVPISAQFHEGINHLVEQMVVVSQESTKTISKKVLNSLPSNLHSPSRGRLLTIRQTATKPPVFHVVLTAPVDKNYVQYLRKVLRQRFGFVGVPVLIKTKIVKSKHYQFKGGSPD